MAKAVGPFELVQALDAEGFPLPAECREARIIIGIDQVVMIQYDVVLTADNLAKLGRAMQRCAETEK